MTSAANTTTTKNRKEPTMFLSSESAQAAEFEIHPKGIVKAQCVEVITTNKKTGEPFAKTVEGVTKNRLILVFQSEKTTTDPNTGEPIHMVFWDWHNIPQSLANENGALHKRLSEWEVPIKDYETQSAFENEVVGRPATLVFSHTVSDKTGKTYANISSCIAAEEGEPTFQAVNYKKYND